MPPPGQTVAAAATDHVTFTAHHFARVKIIYVRAYFHDFSDKLMADHHGDRNGRLRPIVPFENVQIGAADTGVADPNQYIVDTDPGLWNILKREPWITRALDERLHLQYPDLSIFAIHLYGKSHAALHIQAIRMFLLSRNADDTHLRSGS